MTANDGGPASEFALGMSEKILGYDWAEIQARQMKCHAPKAIDTSAPGDYGADPIGDGTFRMVPSGDIVGWEERNKRLNRPDARSTQPEE